MHAYAVQPSAGLIKLDAMENPFTLPPELRAAFGARLAAVAINRYPGARTDDLMGALAAFADLPAGCALMLGNGSDELIDLLSVACGAPGATHPGAAAGLRDVRDVGAAARPAFRRRAADGRLPARRDGDAGGHRTQPPGADLSGLPEQPDGQPVGRRRDRAHRRRGRRAGRLRRDGRGLPALRVAHLDAAHGARQPHVLVLRTLSASSAWPACAWAICAAPRR